jgi:putative glycosyltransferase (TIGR04348 family)
MSGLASAPALVPPDRSLRIQVVTPHLADTPTGNVLTATRYARLLRALGHRVAVAERYAGEPCDVLIALHARRSHPAIQRYAAERPEQPLIVVLTGTDLYRDILVDPNAQRSLELATRLVVLQSQGLAALPERFRAKTRVIYQSAPLLQAQVQRPTAHFRVSVVGHLRPEKDPFRTALAARHLPAASRVRVVHLGRALLPTLGARARREEAVNPRYRWLGGRPHWQTRRLVAGSHLLAITSRMEGSSNVLGEALAQAVPTPVVATRIGGLVGTLGEVYPGYFAVGDTRGLAALLRRAETDADYYAQLAAHCARVAALVSPERERDAWHQLLAELGQRPAGADARVAARRFGQRQPSRRGGATLSAR